MRWRQFGVVFRHELGSLLVSRHGWLTLVCFLCLYGALSSLLPLAHEGVTNFTEDLGQAGDQGSSQVATLMDANNSEPVPAPTATLAPSLSLVRQTIGAEPAVLLMLFLFVLWAAPGLAMLTAYDQMAGDLWSRHARFLLVRTSRPVLLVGKLLAAWALFVIALGLASALAAGLLPWGDHGLEGTSGLLYLCRVWATISLYALPYIAFLSLTGVLLAKPIAALAAGFASLLAMFMIGDVLSGPEGVGLVFDWAGWLWPSAMKYHLLLHSPRWVLLGAAHLLGLSLLYAGLAYWRLQGRDV